MPSATGGSQAERPSVSERRIIGVELRDLTQLETEALLDRDVSACLAFVDGAGFPRQVPCWFLWDGEAFYVTSVAEKFHVKRLQADARASICVELEERTESGRTNRQVKGVGRVEIFADDAGHWSERIRSKYLGDLVVRQPTSVASRVVLRLKPDRLVAHGGGIRVA
jgi:nitroimidazol reductase NimA-like FMN-containing flavoprotein (pyridoxamine 5'-phosphate oxidase superfamily)